MAVLTLNLSKGKCEESCPLPIDILPELVEGVEEVEENNGKTEIKFNKTKISEEELIKELERRNYKTGKD